VSIILLQTKLSHNEDGGSTFPQRVCNTCCENPKNHHHLNNAAKTWKPTLRTRVSHSFTLCNVSSVEWLFGTDFMYCCLHSATDHILEDTSHHITQHSSYSVLLGSISRRVSLSLSSVSPTTCTSISVVEPSHWSSSSCNKTHNNEDTFKEQDWGLTK